jgi:hypothetical protein
MPNDNIRQVLAEYIIHLDHSLLTFTDMGQEAVGHMVEVGGL